MIENTQYIIEIQTPDETTVARIHEVYSPRSPLPSQYPIDESRFEELRNRGVSVVKVNVRRVNHSH